MGFGFAVLPSFLAGPLIASPTFFAACPMPCSSLPKPCSVFFAMSLAPSASAQAGPLAATAKSPAATSMPSRARFALIGSTEHVEEQGVKLFRLAEEIGLEGVVAKRADALPQFRDQIELFALIPQPFAPSGSACRL